MVFENDRLFTPNQGASRKERASASLRRNLLSAGIVASLTATGYFLPDLLLAPGFKGFSSHASVAIVNSSGGPAGVERAANQLRENLLSPVALSIITSDLGIGPHELFGARHQGYLAVLLDLLAGGGKDAEPLVGATEDGLKDAVSISSVPQDGRINIDVVAATPGASKRIADYFAGRVVKEFGSQRGEASAGDLETARVALDNAGAALAGFQMRHGDDAVSRIQSLQQKIRDDDATIASLRARQTQLEDAITAASSMKVDSVLNGSLPALAAFRPLETIRESYTAAKLELADVNVDHGPRHPRTIAAQATLDAARATAMPALRRVLDALKHEQASLLAEMENLSRLRADLDTQMQALGDAPADLARREAALEKARRDYIMSSEAAGSVASVPRASASLATAPDAGVANYDRFTANAMAVAGAMAGLLASLVLLSFRREEEEYEHDVVASLDAVSANTPEAGETLEDQEPLIADDRIEIEPAIFDDIATDEVEPQLLDEPVIDQLDATPSPDEYVAHEPDELHAEPANDIPLDERVRQVLMHNAVPAERLEAKPPVFKLPPLLAAALAGEVAHDQAETEELRALRQELALLRARLSQHGIRDEQGRNRA